MIDPQGRTITNLRISVTQECNLNCPYCHREGEYNGYGDEMSVEKIKKLVESASKLGIKWVKITGGEPLLRQDIIKIVETISKTPGILEVSITTNGTLLEKLAKPLADAGLKRINIGCDSLSSSISGKTINNILPGVIAAKNAGLYPVKLNMVVMKGINDDEIEGMMNFAKKFGCILQLIELVPFDVEFHKNYFFSLENLENKLKKSADKIIIRKMNSRRQYFVGDLVVEVVRPHLNRKFCESCEKLRVTSDGKIKPCLMRDDNLVDTNENNEDINELFDKAMKKRELYYN